MTKAILINVKEKTIEEVEFSDFHDIQNLINCDVFAGMNLDANILLYYDEEGLLKDNKSGFMISHNPYQQPIMGNGLIVKIDEHGNDIDLNLNIEYVMKDVTFIDFDEPPKFL